MKMFNITAILCAAGLSKRMGTQNKLLLAFKGKPLIIHMINEILASKVDDLIVVTGYQNDLIEPMILRHASDRMNIVQNVGYLNGQTSTIQTGLKMISSTVSAFMICLSDMPLLTCDHYDSLIDFHLNYQYEEVGYISRPFFHGKPGHPVIMDCSFKQEVMECHDKEGCRSVIKKNESLLNKYVTKDPAFYKDVDTRKAYAKIVGS